MVVCWSRKGGVGTTVVAGAMALSLPGSVLLVDLAGDLPVLFGAERPTTGLADWLGAPPAVGLEALGRLEEEVAPGVHLLPRGRGPLPLDKVVQLVAGLGAEGRSVVVDAGIAEGCPVARAVAVAARRRLLVVRACPLARRDEGVLEPTGVVVVRDPGRAVGVRSLGEPGGPLVAEVGVDPAVGRAVDLGFHRARLPRSFTAVLRSVASS
jgi:hypothetical protein